MVDTGYVLLMKVQKYQMFKKYKLSHNSLNKPKADRGFLFFWGLLVAAGIWPNFLVYLFGLLKGFYIHTRLSLILVQKCSASIQEKVKGYP